MKKITLSFLAITFLFFSCKRDIADVVPHEDEVVSAELKRCYSAEIYEELIATDPIFKDKQQKLELHTMQFSETMGKLVNGELVIPVYVHVLYRTADENISDAQVQSQIAVLNEDFNAMNADLNKSSLYND